MAKKTLISALLILLAVGTTVARAESVSKLWIVPAAGIRTSTSFGITSTDEDLAYTRINFSGGFAFGLSVGYRLSEFLSVEAMWSRMNTTIQGVIPGDPAPMNEDLFKAFEDQFHANLMLSAGYSIGSIKPYFLLGAGLTSVNPRTGVAGVSRFSWGLGLGFDGMVSKRIGIRLQGKFTPTYINTTEQILSEWVGGFQATAARNNMSQWEITGGLIYRF